MFSTYYSLNNFFVADLWMDSTRSPNAHGHRLL